MQIERCAQNSLVAVVLAAGIAVALALPALAQETTTEGQMPQMSEQLMAEMAAWMEANRPGVHHEHLANLAGDWDAVVTWWPDPSGEPVASTGAMTSRVVLGGRYLHSTYRGEMMGLPFEGAGIDAYDTIADEYVSLWMDSMTTGVMRWSGGCNGNGTVRTMVGEMKGPNGEIVRSKTVTTVRDDDTYSYESFRIAADGTEVKEMEIVMKRK
jgi:hypothetical protein